MSKNPIYVPAISLDDWRRLLADPEKHWKQKYSAVLLAKSWHGTQGFPQVIGDVFSAAGEPFRSLSPLIIVPEHKVQLPGVKPPSMRGASQSDVWVLASHLRGLASITVEGKVSEVLGDTMEKWRRKLSAGKRERIQFITELLGIPVDVPGTIRYQLLHRTTSAIMEAQRFHADTALMLVQSFSSTNAGFTDFEAFARLFGSVAHPNEIIPIGACGGIHTYISWIRNPTRS